MLLRRDRPGQGHWEVGRQGAQLQGRCSNLGRRGSDQEGSGERVGSREVTRRGPRWLGLSRPEAELTFPKQGRQGRVWGTGSRSVWPCLRDTALSHPGGQESRRRLAEQGVSSGVLAGWASILVGDEPRVEEVGVLQTWCRGAHRPDGCIRS